MTRDDLAVALETMAPQAPPAALPLAPPAPAVTLGYESGLNRARVGQSRWAIASFVLCAVTVAYCVVCFIGMTRASRWDGLAWLVFGFLGNWVGCGLAALLALGGVLQRRRRRRLAAHALWVSLTLGVGPIAFLWAAPRLHL